MIKVYLVAPTYPEFSEEMSIYVIATDLKWTVLMSLYDSRTTWACLEEIYAFWGVGAGEGVVNIPARAGVTDF